MRLTEEATAGKRVAFYRRRQWITQEVLAGLLGRSVEWLAQLPVRWAAWAVLPRRFRPSALAPLRYRVGLLGSRVWSAWWEAAASSCCHRA